MGLEKETRKANDLSGNIEDGIDAVNADSNNDSAETKINDSNSKIIKLEQERDNFKDLAMRMKADFDNFRKRLDAENNYKIEESQKKIFLELLNISDSYEIAIVNFDSIIKRLNDCNDAKKDEINSNYKGLILTFEMLKDFLQNHGIQEVKIDSGSIFDHNLHEILLQENNTKYKNREIIEVFQKGYLFKGRLLRTAKVKVTVNESNEKQK